MPLVKQDLIQAFFYSGDLGEAGVTYELQCMLCWSMLVIGSLVFAKSLGTKPGNLAGH